MLLYLQLGFCFMLQLLPDQMCCSCCLLNTGLSSGCGCCLQSVLGEGASVVLEGQKVISSRTQDAGFTFRYKSLQDALLNFQ